MLRKFIGLLLFINCFVAHQLYADTYPEVVFDNSIVNGTYAKSTVTYSGESWVENINKHLLVSDTVFFTPGNALSLKYYSSPKGIWETSINYNRLKYNYIPESNETLSLWLYVDSKNTKAADLPRLFIRQPNSSSDTLDVSSYISNLQLNKWIQLKIPVKNFKIKQKTNPIIGIGFAQKPGSTKGYHHIYLDQIEFLPFKYSEIPLRSAAMLSEAQSYDKTVHLKWQLPLTPSIRYVKIYRSADGQLFSPIAIRPIHMQSCFDIVPQMDKKYYYKITWLDYNYKESAYSKVKEVETKPLADTSILKLVQLAHVNYFVENFDVNTGMHLPYRSKHKVIVSTKETAGAVLSLLVGVQHDFVTRHAALNRISRIVFFLLKSQNKNGILPAYFDGRKGLPEYSRGDAVYDVQATASIVEALLVARQYFDKDSEGERDLRARITQLYNQINWTACLTPDQHYIQEKLALLDNPQQLNKPLVGFDEALNTYLLALGENKNAISPTLYFNALYGRQEIPVIHPEELEFDRIDSVMHSRHSLHTQSINSNMPLVKYGIKLPFGIYEKSLMNIYRPFLTVRPESVNDSLTNWNEVLKNYVTYAKRRDNEVGVGATNSDIWGFYQHRDTTAGSYRLNPAISSASIIVDKEYGQRAIINLYKQYGSILFTEYGFRAWLDLRNDDVSDEYISLNQAAVAIMLENYNSGLIWDLYDKIPELKRSRNLIKSK